MSHGYDSGRLNLPFVGIATFGKYPLCLDWEVIDADVAVLGAPFDFGTQWRSGARFGPRAIREASTLFAFGHAGAYDHEDDAVYLPAASTRIVDIGDADIIHTDTLRSHANIEVGVRKILAAGALPVVLGGDHSITIPAIAAFSEEPPIHVVQFDAHLDFVDERHGVRFGHGSPMRRAAERAHVTGLTQLGIRNVSSTAREGYADARRMGSDILSVRQIRKLGTEARARPHPGRASATTSPSTSTASIRRSPPAPARRAMAASPTTRCWSCSPASAARGTVAGVDLVEVAPDYDHTGTTAILAAQLLLNLHRPHPPRARRRLRAAHARAPRAPAFPPEKCRKPVAGRPQSRGHSRPQRGAAGRQRSCRAARRQNRHPRRSAAEIPSPEAFSRSRRGA